MNLRFLSDVVTVCCVCYRFESQSHLLDAQPYSVDLIRLALVC